VSRRARKSTVRGEGFTTVVVLRLYVAGGAPNSLRAIANVEAICAGYLENGHELEIVDRKSLEAASFAC